MKNPFLMISLLVANIIVFAFVGIAVKNVAKKIENQNKMYEKQTKIVKKTHKRVKRLELA